jgi:hypothetical protein
VDLNARVTLVYRLGARAAYGRPRTVGFDQPLSALIAPDAKLVLAELE